MAQSILVIGSRVAIPSSMRLKILDKIHKEHYGIIQVPRATTWHVVATDLFQLKGTEYLIVIDYFSRYVEVTVMEKTTSRARSLGHSRPYFQEIPGQMQSDNGPQFDSAEFSHFGRE